MAPAVEGACRGERWHPSLLHSSSTPAATPSTCTAVSISSCSLLLEREAKSIVIYLNFQSLFHLYNPTYKSSNQKIQRNEIGKQKLPSLLNQTWNCNRLNSSITSRKGT